MEQIVEMQDSMNVEEVAATVTDRLVDYAELTAEQTGIISFATVLAIATMPDNAFEEYLEYTNNALKSYRTLSDDEIRIVGELLAGHPGPDTDEDYDTFINLCERLWPGSMEFLNEETE